MLGVADVVVLNDPITGQGSNNAAKCAATYLRAIVERGSQPFDADWMRETFDRFWTQARHVTDWTNALLAPAEPHHFALLGAAGQHPEIAHRFVNGFNDPADYAEWVHGRRPGRGLPGAGSRHETAAGGLRAVRDRRGGDHDGDRRRGAGRGDRQLLHLGLARPAAGALVPVETARPARPLFPAGAGGSRSTILAADQDHLSRRFATPSADKFAGVELVHALLPILAGTLASFVCRDGARPRRRRPPHLRRRGGGLPADRREPLVFHSGRYREFWPEMAVDEGRVGVARQVT